MKNDLDRLMRENDIDAILVCGPGQHNAEMVYLGGGGHLTHADLIKVRDAEALLFYRTMERDEAGRTGLHIKDAADYAWDDLLKQANGDRIKALALRYQQMLLEVGLLKGRLAIYGKGALGEAYAVFNELQRITPAVTLVGELAEQNILLQARATKEAGEVERIRRMGQITTRVVGRTAEFLTSQQVQDGVLIQTNGKPLTIADVKKLINLWISEEGAENPDGTIFAIGYDAAVPHSTGTGSDLLRIGQTIVYDIFPCEALGGYYYDFTRTWCLGHAKDEILAVYEDVLAVSQRIKDELALGKPCRQAQERACALFEERKHPTINSNPRTMDGYVHSIGHGLGLDVHEAPWLNAKSPPGEVLQANMVFTIEPGLYYPERGIGVRIEDTLWLRPDGQAEVLAEFPADLILPMRR
jgi:Xaa-Pro aminopeptidase